MEGQLRKLGNNTHPKTGAELPAAIELDKYIVAPRDAKSDVEHVAPEGFYEYVPATLTVAASPIVVNGMSSEERRAAFHERIKAKESANVEAMKGGGGGDAIDLASVEAVMPDVAEDKGGGVWNCLFAGEKQFPEEPIIDRRVAATACRGKYRIKVKGAACQGGHCCKGT
jgi:hypothetical protein